MGFLRRPASLVERVLYVAGGLLLLDPNPFTDLLGLGVAGLGYLSERANFSPRLLGGRPTG